MSENWTKRTLTVDHSGKGIDQGAKGMTIADAHATIDRMKDETKNLERRLSRLDGRGGSPDHVEPEFFVPVDRKTGAIGGDEAPRALKQAQRRALAEDPDEVLPEYFVPVDRSTGVIGGD
ncbi:MAG: hypothetical protein A4E36_00094 [Methanoregulaceae archaeon PtaB.Bin009]|jgi:hypothetical protein|nr:MAG: hypothetical protein A4E36_00094 [Methanoregulaceae archaeon PtaB.Bin009]OPY42370.1 MAG: hypothetical protein A4E41_00362 [Methanoregulaceae archaeon PtaU1.Bin066]